MSILTAKKSRRLEPRSSISHSQRLNRVSNNTNSKSKEATIPETDEDERGRSGNNDTNGFDHALDADSGAEGFGGGGGGGGGFFGGVGGSNFELDDDDGDLDFGGFGDGDGGLGLEDGEDEKLLEDLEDKQLLARIQALEAENSGLTEKVWKLEHGRTWVENRLTALEAEVTALKGAPLASMTSLQPDKE